ncbi:MAG: hypothetical protein V1779_11565 [bacterium]
MEKNNNYKTFNYEEVKIFQYLDNETSIQGKIEYCLWLSEKLFIQINEFPSPWPLNLSLQMSNKMLYKTKQGLLTENNIKLKIKKYDNLISILKDKIDYYSASLKNGINLPVKEMNYYNYFDVCNNGKFKLQKAKIYDFVYALHLIHGYYDNSLVTTIRLKEKFDFTDKNWNSIRQYIKDKIHQTWKDRTNKVNNIENLQKEINLILQNEG